MVFFDAFKDVITALPDLDLFYFFMGCGVLVSVVGITLRFVDWR